MTSTFGPPPDPTAVLGRRFGASVIDSLVSFATLAAAALLVFGAIQPTLWTRDDLGSTEAARRRCAQVNRAAEDGDEDASRLCVQDGTEVVLIEVGEALGVAFLAGGLSLVLNLLNAVLLQGLTGASLGKLAFGLRVVRPDGQLAGIGWAALRYLLLSVEGGLIGGILVLCTKGHRRLGDMAADTYVVATASVGTPVAVPGTGAPLQPAWAAPTWGPPPGWGGSAGQPPTGPPPPWGAPSGWSPPPAAPAPTSAAVAPSSDGPFWDEVRDTYIQFDRSRDEWVHWDERGERWVPIDT